MIIYRFIQAMLLMLFMNFAIVGDFRAMLDCLVFAALLWVMNVNANFARRVSLALKDSTDKQNDLNEQIGTIAEHINKILRGIQQDKAKKEIH